MNFLTMSPDALRLDYFYFQRNPPPTHFITFANRSFLQPTRILEEASRFPFQTRRALTELDLGAFGEKHATFLAENPRGYGLWIWKPKIILDTLMSIKDNEVVVYCDAGMHLNAKGLTRYAGYLQYLKTHDMVTFSLNDAYKAQFYVKRDAIDACYPEFATQTTPYCYAGVMMLKKTPATIALVEEWLQLCETYHFLDASPSVAPEHPNFVGNDCDNGLFNLCLAKHKISYAVYPDETNLYLTNGLQHYTARPEEWALLYAFPFQCRRIRT
jgi:hypothetical protein